MMKRLIIISVLLVACGQAFSQMGAEITINAPRYQFGDVLEANGIAKCEFYFSNSGNDTLRILKLKVSHPDMSAKCDPEIVLPGVGGTIYVELNPANLKGKIERYISIRTNDAAFPIRQMSVAANIIPSPKTTSELYLNHSGNLKFKSKHIAFDNFYNNEIRTDTFEIYNAWYKPMEISVLNPPDYTQWTVIPEKLDPGKEGRVVVKYDAGKSENWGLSLNTFVLQTNDSIESRKMITIGVNILEDFSYYKKMNEPKIPKIDFSVTNHNFGKLTPGSVASYTFTITNKGDGLLIIRKTKASCGCTIPLLDKTELKPGEKAKLEVQFNTLGYTGKQIKTISVISNDPVSPNIMLSVEAELP